MPKLLLEHQCQAFLHIFLDIAHFIILRRVYLVRIALWLIKVPVANLAVVTTRDAISRGFVVKHQRLVLVTGDKKAASGRWRLIGLADALVPFSCQEHIVSVAVSHALKLCERLE